MEVVQGHNCQKPVTVCAIALTLQPFVVVLTLMCEIRRTDSTARSHSAQTSPSASGLVV